MKEIDLKLRGVLRSAVQKLNRSDRLYHEFQRALVEHLPRCRNVPGRLCAFAHAPGACPITRFSHHPLAVTPRDGASLDLSSSYHQVRDSLLMGIPADAIAEVVVPGAHGVIDEAVREALRLVLARLEARLSAALAVEEDLWREPHHVPLSDERGQINRSRRRTRRPGA